MRRYWLLSFCSLLYAATLFAQNAIRVACVGNSVTYGYALPDREQNAYPAQLQRLLGERYEVRNFGHSGSTLLHHGHRPYIKTPEYREALKYAADRVIIHLGLNDTDPRNWPHYNDEFIPDYRALIDSFRAANPKAKIWICRMTPIGFRHPRFQSGTRQWHGQIQRRIEQIAATAHVGLIDLQAPLYARPDLFPDALHPNVEGAGILAHTVYGALTGNYGGLKLPDTYGDNMVLQRERPICLHGRADAGEKVTIKLGKQKATTITTPDGVWETTLESMPAGGPYRLTVSTTKKTIHVNNVWLGEVWVCSGQSNMEFKVNQSTTAKTDLAAADTLGRLHLYNMPARWQTYAVSWPDTVLASINSLQYLKKGRWETCNSRAAANFSAVAYHFGRMLADSLGVHVGLICNAVGGSTTESWISRNTLEEEYPAILYNWRQNDHIMKWARERASLNLKAATNTLQRHPYEPCYLFEAGILPLERYGVKGVIWYQGESNAENIELHERLFPLLIQSWRNHWDTDDLPFYFVQLSGLSTRPSWPQFRDSQRRLAAIIPQTAMAVSSDQGDSLDVHPKRKHEIGKRLALQALYNTYNRKALIPSGPMYQRATRQGNKLNLYFAWDAEMHASSGALRGFEVAGADGIYHAAKAKVHGTTVQVWSEAVKVPCAIRYGWRPYTDANLVNKTGLPASTFRDETIR